MSDLFPRNRRLLTDDSLVNAEPGTAARIIDNLRAAGERLGGFHDDAWLSQHGFDLDDPRILVIPGLGAPDCQFSQDGTIVPRVGDAMRLMRAASEPHGTASWFLLGHAWLPGHAAPATLVRTDPGTLLELAVDAATGD